MLLAETPDLAEGLFGLQCALYDIAAVRERGHSLELEENERGIRCIGGTLFAGEKPRVVEIDNIAMEAEIGANMLYLRNHDKPGFIGQLGTLLGAAGVNIGTFHLGRSSAGGDALAFIEVDGPVPEKVLGQIRELKDYVLRADSLSF